MMQEDKLEMRPVHVVIDGIIFSLQRHGGISESFARLIEQFCGGGVRLSLLLYPGHERNFALQRLLSLSRGEASGLRIIHKSEHPQWARWQRVDTRGLDSGVFHSTYYRLPTEPDRFRVVTTVHDFMHLRYKGWIRRRVMDFMIQRAVRQAQCIVCVSAKTRARLLEAYGQTEQQEVCVIPHGVSPDFHLLEIGTYPVSGAEAPVALFIGQRGGYKNFELAVGGVSRVPGLELQIVGGGAFNKAELKLLQKHLPGRFRHLGWLGAEELNRRLNAAIALVYPSAEEGFGMPVLEASCSGCPAVTTQGAVADEAGALPETSVAPGDVEGLANVLRRLMAEPALRQNVRTRAAELGPTADWAVPAASWLSLYRQQWARGELLST